MQGNVLRSWCVNAILEKVRMIGFKISRDKRNLSLNYKLFVIKHLLTPKTHKTPVLQVKKVKKRQARRFQHIINLSMKTTWVTPQLIQVHSFVTAVYVRFGRLSYHCQRNGICEIKQVQEPSRQETPGRAAYGYLILQGEELKLQLIASSMSQQTRESCFVQQFFLVEENFQTEITLPNSTSVLLSIAKGRYAVEQTSNQFVIQLSSGEELRAATQN